MHGGLALDRAFPARLDATGYPAAANLDRRLAWPRLRGARQSDAGSRVAGRDLGRARSDRGTSGQRAGAAVYNPAPSSLTIGHAMDLGIAGRKAIVCASSRGLGRACARALAEAGCDVTINGRDGKALEETAAELRQTTGAKVIAVQADVAPPQGQAALLIACPEPDILVNNNAGPPFRDFRQLTRAQMLDGVIANMVVAVELIQEVIDGMTQRHFGRIVNITSGSVKAPLAGLDLSSGARAGLTGFLAGVARTVAASNVTINHILPGAFATDRLRSNVNMAAERQGGDFDKLWKQRAEGIPAKRYGNPEEFGKLCSFIASAHARYITGQNFLIDGGMFQGAF